MNFSNSTDTDFVAELWPDLFEGMTGSSNTSAPQEIHEDLILRYPSTPDTGLPSFNDGIDMAFTPTPTTSVGTSTTQWNYSYPDDTHAWAMLAQNTGPVAPQLVSDPDWTGVSPYTASSAAATPNLVVSPISSATPPGSQDGLAWLFGPGHPMSSSFGGTLGAPEFGTGISGVTTYPAGWATNKVGWPISSAPETSATAAPGKRRRDESHDNRVPVMMNSREMPPQKRVRSGKINRIPKTARSATRTRLKPTARIPKSGTNYEPKQPVRGAERLATPDSQGLHHQSLLGPSLQQGWAEEAADGQLIWVEGSVKAVAHRADSTVQQQQKEEVQQEGFEIPKDFKTGYRALLVATQADWARGTVHEIKCRLCPGARFKKWDKFKRHCECNERHTLTIYFCGHCGIHFGRSDSCQRHCNYPPDECIHVTPEEADAKIRATQRKHDEFIRKFSGYSTTGEEVTGMSFSETIKDMNPNSSKKRIMGSRE